MALFEEDEIGVVIMGDGYGESILINIGNNKFIIIDSFLDKDGKPAALSFFDRHNISYDSIKIVVCSHLHNDHIKGLSGILSKCDAKFVTYNIFNEKILKIMFSDTETCENLEFFKVLQQLQLKQSKPEYAFGKRIINHYPGMLFSHEKEVSIEALSPQDYDWDIFVKSIINNQYKHIPSPNHVSIVLLVRIGENFLLFGGDLENSSNSFSGWEQVNKNLNEIHQDKSICFFKIPHHGSYTGYYEKIWEKIHPYNVCAINAFKSGKSNLPTEDMKNKYLEKANILIINGNQRKTIDKTFEKEILQEAMKFNLGLKSVSVLNKDFKISIIKKKADPKLKWVIVANDEFFSEVKSSVL